MADTAAGVALSFSMDAGPVAIGDLRTQQALAALPPVARARLIDGALADLPSRPDWPTLRGTVIAWCESGCNLVAAASALNIHRNTLLYRLEKLEQLLSHPWRDHRRMLATYVAAIAAPASDQRQQM